jgi:hypothetical protein
MSPLVDKSFSSAKKMADRLKTENLPTLHEVSIDNSDHSVADNSIGDSSAGVNSAGDASKLSKSLTTSGKCDDSSTNVKSDQEKCPNRKVRMLPKIPLQAKMFDISKTLSDISANDVLNTSRDSSNVSEGSSTRRTLGQRANSTLDISRTKLAGSVSNPSLNSSLNTSRESDKDPEATIRNRTLGQRANSNLDISSLNAGRHLDDGSNQSRPSGLSLSRSFAELSPGGAVNQSLRRSVADVSPAVADRRSEPDDNWCHCYKTFYVII